jgi:Extensin-like protein C-terminus
MERRPAPWRCILALTSMQRPSRPFALVLLASALSPSAAAQPASKPAEPPYALDSIPREAPATGDLGCPRIEVESYRGDAVRYKPEVWVNASFRARLGAFERVVRDVGIEVYGRPPDRIVQLGGYGCRRMREHAGLLSEHALGNAIDVAGFEFGHLPRGAALPEGLPPVFANGFEVRVLGHWGKRAGYAAVHARFLRTLVLRLMARDDVFRVLLGPGYPGHDNHFHFDVTTYRLVQIFEDGQLLRLPPSP